MTSRVGPAALLRRAWLLTGVLAVIAGLFGMHVMTAGHAAHAAAGHAGVHSSAGHTAVVPSSAGHTAVVPSSAGHTAVVPSPLADSCGHACPSVHDKGPSCTPAANASSLTVLPPAGTTALHPVLHTGTIQAGGYSCLPPSPSPCDLSISRT